MTPNLVQPKLGKAIIEKTNINRKYQMDEMTYLNYNGNSFATSHGSLQPILVSEEAQPDHYNQDFTMHTAIQTFHPFKIHGLKDI